MNQEQCERYEALNDAFVELVGAGISRHSLETLALESGFASKDLEQIVGRQATLSAARMNAAFADIFFNAEGRN